MTTREPYARGECECNRAPGQCVKGDLEHCPTEDEYDDDNELDMEAQCGRWDNGALTSQCRLAGTEWCDWECPIGIGRPKRPRS